MCVNTMLMKNDNSKDHKEVSGRVLHRERLFTRGKTLKTEKFNPRHLLD